MIQTAEKRGAEFEERMAAESSAQGTLTDRSAKAYYKEFKKVSEWVSERVSQSVSHGQFVC